MMRVFGIGMLMLLVASSAFAANPKDVVINEIAWMGSTAAAADEWLELYNNTASDVSLASWTIVKNGSTNWALSGTITAHGYFLIEHADTAVSDVAADLVIAGVSLGNGGNDLTLKDDAGNTIDSVPCLAAGGWYAGSNSAPKPTMERKNPLADGNVASNWADNDGVTMNGHDSGNNVIHGTPKAQNSVYTVVVPGPSVTHVHCLDATAIDVSFDVALDPTTANNQTNYTLNAGSDVNPGAATIDAIDTKLVHLTGISGIAAQSLTTLTVVGVKDTSGNPSNSTAQFYAGVVSMAFARTDANANYIPDIIDNTPNAFFTVQGVVSSASVFTNGEVFFEDATGGLALFDAADSAGLATGDEIQVSGNPTQFNGKFEITGTKHVLVGTGRTVAHTVLTIAALLAAPESYESMLIGIKAVSITAGTWPAAAADANLTITDDAGTSTLTLRIDKDTNIDGSVQPANPFDILGIATQYSTATPPNDAYQIEPRSLLDINAICSTDGQTRSCYDGPAGTDTHLPCKDGLQTCSGGLYGACVGETLPGPTDSTCNGIDDNCDGSTDEGANTATDPQNCGSCGHVCALPNVKTNGCAASACTITTCDDGFFDCNGTAPDGCETQLGTDTHCASCSNDCTVLFPNATGTCNTGVCQIGACNTNFGNCDANDNNGCEASLKGDHDNCGTCAHVCAQNETCANSQCGTTCPDADHDNHAAATCGGDDCDDSDPAVHPGATEICDGKDNNCDGHTDETFVDRGKPCDGPDTDLCKNGVFVCNATQDGLDCDETIHKVELCNGLDDDCDGLTDEDWPDLGQPCDGPDSDKCKNGIYVCNTAGNGIVCNEDPTSTNKVEICNGLDDDCDGVTDNGFEGNTTCGTGACANTVPKCLNGVPQSCTPKAKPMEKETGAYCHDGIDNDCDGFTDMADSDCGGGGGGCSCATSSGGYSAAFLGLLVLGLVGLLRKRG